jgi:hypothetical protein
LGRKHYCSAWHCLLNNIFAIIVADTVANAVLHLLLIIFWQWLNLIPIAITTWKGISDMARAKKGEDDLSAIEAKRAMLKAELAKLNDAEKRAKNATRDAGRPVLMAALLKVKIGKMEIAEAKAIAKAIETIGGAAVAQKLG